MKEFYYDGAYKVEHECYLVKDLGLNSVIMLE